MQFREMDFLKFENNELNLKVYRDIMVSGFLDTLPEYLLGHKAIPYLGHSFLYFIDFIH